MNTEDYILIIYALISFIYGKHSIEKGEMDFQILAFLYLCLICLYYRNKTTIEHESKDDYFNENNVNDMLSFLYGIIFLIYLKHIKYKSDIDYVYMSLPIFLISVIKYNVLSKKGTKKLTYLENVNHISIFLIACTFAKHGVSQSEHDYAVLSGLYLSYLISTYKLNKKKELDENLITH